LRKGIYYVFLPLVLGALLYLFLRKDAPKFVIEGYDFFRSFFEFDLSHRQILHLDSNWDWVNYNLPDALWAFSLTSFILLATRKDNHYTKFFYLFISIVIMLVLEMKVGTFDWLDIAAMLIGSCASIARLGLQQHT
jgi:hypothetical protein